MLIVYYVVDIDQLSRILNVVGTPDDELIDKIQSVDARNYIKNLTKQPGKDCSKYFANASPAAVDLLKRMLNLDPDKRFVCLLNKQSYIQII